MILVSEMFCGVLGKFKHNKTLPVLLPITSQVYSLNLHSDLIVHIIRWYFLNKTIQFCNYWHTTLHPLEFFRNFQNFQFFYVCVVHRGEGFHGIFSFQETVGYSINKSFKKPLKTSEPRRTLRQAGCLWLENKRLDLRFAQSIIALRWHFLLAQITSAINNGKAVIRTASFQVQSYDLDLNHLASQSYD